MQPICSCRPLTRGQSFTTCHTPPCVSTRLISSTLRGFSQARTYTMEDRRFSYSEFRFVTLGLLYGVVVAIAHTETPTELRIISMRKATRHEQAIFFENA
jgi:uncharacterized DUF497 family protein